ncbi:MAG: ATP-dependent helicase [Lachnospiraceae bacterium]|nr:ATP-dependent helicase [Lachnospiraceae bacterium]
MQKTNIPDYLSSATDRQKEAILFDRGQMMVIAGPGSGKTSVITKRLRYLIQQRSIPPQEILTITFTKAAALSMQSRAVSECKKASLAVFGTFHSVFYQIIKSSGYFKGFTFLSKSQAEKILQIALSSVRGSGLIPPEETEDAGQLLSRISYYKNTGSCKGFGSEGIKELALAYESECKARKKLDFDDLCVYADRLLAQKEELLHFWQRRFSYVQIDEFQDINPIQYRIVEKLTALRQNLFVVGDDDQSIYAFRGAAPDCMEVFMQGHPAAKRVLLTDNFRSAPSIVKISSGFIENNTVRTAKKLASANKSKEGCVEIRRFDEDKFEVKEITDLIAKTYRESLMSQGNAEEVTQAVLVRTNHDMEPYASALTAAKIPFTIRERRKSMWDLACIDDYRAFLRFVFEGRRRSDLLRFMNKPERMLSRNELEEEIVDPEAVLALCRERGLSERERIWKKLFLQLSLGAELDHYGCCHLFFEVLGYDRYLRERKEKERQEGQRARQSLFGIANFKKGSEFLRFFEEYNRQLEESLEKGRDNPSGKASESCISVMTYHGSKGLEFDRVYLPGINDRTVPPKRVMASRDELEEERRMFYVAMTRAKEKLLISCVFNPENTQEKESLFIEELRDVKDHISSNSTSSRN